MDKINLHNYEAYFLDYSEGNLSKVQQIELQEFLVKHPELKSELDEFSSIILEQDSTENQSLKSSLLREETTELPLKDYLMIAQAEGVISANEKKQLAVLVEEDSTLMNDLAIYHKTKLEGEKSLLFPNKSVLIQKESKGIVWWQYASAVAAAVIVFVIWNGNNSNQIYSPRSGAYYSNYNESAEKEGYKFILEKLENAEVENKRPFIDLQKQTPNQVQLAKAEKGTAQEKIEKKTLEIQFADSKIEDKKDSATTKKTIIDDKTFAEKARDYQKAGTSNSQDSSHVKQTVEPQDDQLAENKEDQFVPINEFAKNKYKEAVSKIKTYSETAIDELADATNDKIIVDREKDSRGNTQKFAINIGKFSISRNK